MWSLIANHSYTCRAKINILYTCILGLCRNASYTCMVLCWYTLVHTEEGRIEFFISVHIVLNCAGTLPTRGH